MFSFFFACGLASFLTTSPSTWELWHSRHSGYSRAALLAGQLCPFAFACAHLANHGAHFIELLNQLVDFLNGRTTAASNAFAAASIDDVGIASLLQGHGKDNRLDMFHLVAFQCLFHLWHRRQFVEAWNHFHYLSQWPHAFELAHGGKKILQVELALL